MQIVGWENKELRNFALSVMSKNKTFEKKVRDVLDIYYIEHKFSTIENLNNINNRDNIIKHIKSYELIDRENLLTILKLIGDDDLINFLNENAYEFSKERHYLEN